jgi:hypothetical protein
MSKHKHAENMLAYAQDAMETDKPWERWEWFNEHDQKWEALTLNPKWGGIAQYRRKPRTININGFDVPEPVREPLAIGQEYFIPLIANLFVMSQHYELHIWIGGHIDNCWLEKGLIHLTKEAAETHGKAILSFTEKK